ncbi:MBL fold metallo-hydrolase [Capnocytophaga haemolytica]
MKAIVINSGSDGNAVLYGSVLVDCGVSFSKLKPYIQQIQLVLLTHAHNDHLNVRTLQMLQKARPAVRIGCPDYLLAELSGLDNIDVYNIDFLTKSDVWVNYGDFKIKPVKLYHDKPNVGYRIFIYEWSGVSGQRSVPYKILHCTDTATLEGITARGYDLYAIEHNYDEEKAQRAIEEARAKGRYCHAVGSIKTHLSWQQAREFIEANRKEDSQILELHKSEKFY